MKRLSILILFVISLLSSFSATVTEATAKALAIKHNKAIDHRTTGATLYEQTSQYYIFRMQPKGFCIVSNEDNVRPILGYDTGSVFKHNAEVDFHLRKIRNQIDTVRLFNLRSSRRIDAAWKSAKLSPLSTAAVAPLCATTWDQEPLYNDSCPVYEGSYCVTGCVATAMAQIIKYWNYPSTGAGYYSYSDSTSHGYQENIGVQSFNFGATSFQWQNMTNAVTSNPASISSIAQLMKACGVSVAMDYAPGGSGAWVLQADANSSGSNYSTSAQTAYATYFKYNSGTIQGLYKSNYTSSAWLALIVNEIVNGRPVQLAGWDLIYGGHTFVGDGYDGDTLIHINWGWGGVANGYYSLYALDPASQPYAFNSNDEVLIGIQPIGTTPCNPVTSMVASLGSNSVTATWAASSNAAYYAPSWEDTSLKIWNYLPTTTGLTASIPAPYGSKTYQMRVEPVCPGDGLGAIIYSNNISTPACTASSGFNYNADVITANSLKLNWYPPAGALSYKILLYKPNQTSPLETIDSGITSNTYYTFTGLGSAWFYEYQVQSICANSSSQLSGIGGEVTSGTPCPYPLLNQTTEITPTSALLSWTPQPGAVSYEVLWGLVGAFNNSVSVTADSTRLTGLSPSTNYNFEVSTICSSNASVYPYYQIFSTPAAGACIYPSANTPTNITTNSATFSWSAATGALSYNVTCNGVSTNTTATSYNMTGLSPNTTYEYSLQTVCSSGTSNTTLNIFTTLPLPLSCGVTSLLPVTNVTTSGGTLNWSIASGAVSYNIVANGNSYNTTATYLTLTGLKQNTTYPYTVQTVCSSNTASPVSGSFITACLNPTTPIISAITLSGATATWTNSTLINLLYRDSLSPVWDTVKNITTTSYVLSGLASNNTYYVELANTVCNFVTVPAKFTTNVTPPSPVPTTPAVSSITTTSAAVTWTNSTNANLIYRDSTSATWDTIKGISATSYSLTGLTSCHSYYVAVNNNCTYNSASYTTPVKFSISCVAPPPASYCISSAESNAFEYTKNVTLKTINNTSTKALYANFTNLSTSLHAGSTDTIFLTPGFSTATPWSEHFVAFIDYQQDALFTDAGDNIGTVVTPAAYITPGQIIFTVPAGAKLGSTRLRVVQSWDGYQPVTVSCGDYSYGQTSDYTVTIIP